MSTPRRVPGIGIGQIEDFLVLRAMTMIDGSPLLDQIAAWKEEDKRGPGGRPETFSTRALLVAMLLAAMTDQPMFATKFTEILFRQISPSMRLGLGVQKPPERLDRKSWDALYRTVRYRFHSLITLMDPSPLPKNRRLKDLDFIALVELRRGCRTQEEWNRQGQRLTWFINQVLEMSVRTLPREVRRKWKGSVAVDATVIPAFARPDRREKRKRKGVAPQVITHSSDPDADWYHREKREDPNGEIDSQFSVWGYEASLVVSGSDDPNEPGAMPSLVVGMAPLHKPGTEPGKNGIRALLSVRDRGHPAHYLAGDRAYSNAKPEDFQLPARALGYQLVLDYKIDQLGIQGSHQGMLLVDGSWSCPSIPEALITATRDIRNGIIDQQTYEMRLRERQNYLILSKGRSQGRWPWSGPLPGSASSAAGPVPSEAQLGSIGPPVQSADTCLRRPQISDAKDLLPAERHLAPGVRRQVLAAATSRHRGVARGVLDLAELGRGDERLHQGRGS